MLWKIEWGFPVSRKCLRLFADLKAFERRLTEYVQCLGPQTGKWRRKSFKIELTVLKRISDQYLRLSIFSDCPSYGKNMRDVKLVLNVSERVVMLRRIWQLGVLIVSANPSTWKFRLDVN